MQYTNSAAGHAADQQELQPFHGQHMLRLDGKVALVTGCGTRGEGWGNGKAIAVLLARQGATVFGVDRDLDAAKVTQKIIDEEGGKAHVTTANVTIAEDVQKMVKSCMDMYGSNRYFDQQRGPV
jgi:NAD(P)-dependent dehydrogenase (short-subunit alcohol dehydrogenase family)